MNRAIIVAAGQGLRMGAGRRKQFLLLAGRPILAHTLCAFDNCRVIDQIILVIPAEETAFCQKNIIEPAGLIDKVTLVAGGRRRQDSVFNGIESIGDNEGIVLIHDGVRPLVTCALIEACIQGSKERGSCIPALLPVDTLKMVNGNGVVTRTIDRGSLRMVQTPQAFQLPIIRTAHQQAKNKGWEATDDASLVERIGLDVHIIQGVQENFKITTAGDLALAEFYLSQRLAAENAF